MRQVHSPRHRETLNFSKENGFIGISNQCRVRGITLHSDSLLKGLGNFYEQRGKSYRGEAIQASFYQRDVELKHLWETMVRQGLVPQCPWSVGSSLLKGLSWLLHRLPWVSWLCRLGLQSLIVVIALVACFFLCVLSISNLQSPSCIPFCACTAMHQAALPSKQKLDTHNQIPYRNNTYVIIRQRVGEI